MLRSVRTSIHRGSFERGHWCGQTRTKIPISARGTNEKEEEGKNDDDDVEADKRLQIVTPV